MREARARKGRASLARRMRASAPAQKPHLFTFAYISRGNPGSAHAAACKLKSLSSLRARNRAQFRRFRSAQPSHSVAIPLHSEAARLRFRIRNGFGSATRTGFAGGNGRRGPGHRGSGARGLRRRSAGQRLADRVEEGVHVEGFREVAEESGRQALLDVAREGGGAQRHDRGCARLGPGNPAQDSRDGPGSCFFSTFHF